LAQSYTTMAASGACQYTKMRKSSRGVTAHRRGVGGRRRDNGATALRHRKRRPVCPRGPPSTKELTLVILPERTVGWWQGQTRGTMGGSSSRSYKGKMGLHGGVSARHDRVRLPRWVDA
jgi:hypothetical protein